MFDSSLVSGRSVTKVGGSIQSVVSNERMDSSVAMEGSKTWVSAGSVMVRGEHYRRPPTARGTNA